MQTSYDIIFQVLKCTESLAYSTMAQNGDVENQIPNLQNALQFKGNLKSWAFL